MKNLIINYVNYFTCNFYLRFKYYHEAEPLLKQALKTNFSNNYKAYATNILGYIYNEGKLGERNYDLAIKYCLIAHELNPENLLYLLNLAYSYSNAGHYKEAEHLLKQVLETNLSNEYKSYATNILGYIYSEGKLGQRNYDLAIHYQLIAHELAPQDPFYLLNLAYSYSNARHYKKAEPLLKQVLETNLSNEDKSHAASILGNMYSKGKLGEVNYDLAIHYQLIAHELAPENPFYLRELAYIYSNAKHYKEAEPLLKQVLETNLSNEDKASAAIILGYIHTDENELNYDLAIHYYKIAHELAPQDLFYLRELAFTYKNAEHYKEAELTLKQCLDNATIDLNFEIQAHCASDLAYLYKEGKIAHQYHEVASYYLNIAHEIDPSNSKYIHELAMEYYATGNYEEAEPLLKQCIDTSINDDRNECAYFLQHLPEYFLLD